MYSKLERSVTTWTSPRLSNKQLQLTSIDSAIALLSQATRRVDSAAEPRR